MRLLKLGLGAALTALLVSPTEVVEAQAPPPAYPPPPGYGVAPGYAPYGYPAYPAAQGPAQLKYREDQPIPPGYVLSTEPRTGLIVAGSLVLGVPYVMGVTFASAANFTNQSTWLLLPALGPWMTIALRDSSCDDRDIAAGIRCAADIYLTMLLTLDGLAQTAGTIMLVLGATSPRKVLVRQDLAHIWLTPSRVGEGYGLSLDGTF